MKLFSLALFISILVLVPNKGLSATCPPAPSEFDLSVRVKTTFDKANGNYNYEYTVQNAAASKLPLFQLLFFLPADALATKQPANWEKRFVQKNEVAYVQFYTTSTLIEPGSHATFSISSRFAPGLVRMSAEGVVAPIPMQPTVDDDEAPADCPGNFHDVPFTSQLKVYSVEGPAPANQVTLRAKSKLKRRSPIKGENDEASPIPLAPADQGELQVLLYSTDGFDLNKIARDTIRLGPGNAAPLSAEILPVEKIDKSWKEKPAAVGRVMKLVFNLQSIKIRCNLDATIFLSAKAGQSEVVSTIPVSPAKCVRALGN